MRGNIVFKKKNQSTLSTGSLTNFGEIRQEQKLHKPPFLEFGYFSKSRKLARTRINWWGLLSRTARLSPENNWSVFSFNGVSGLLLLHYRLRNKGNASV